MSVASLKVAARPAFAPRSVPDAKNDLELPVGDDRGDVGDCGGDDGAADNECFLVRGTGVSFRGDVGFEAEEKEEGLEEIKEIEEDVVGGNLVVDNEVEESFGTGAATPSEVID